MGAALLSPCAIFNLYVSLVLGRRSASGFGRNGAVDCTFHPPSLCRGARDVARPRSRSTLGTLDDESFLDHPAGHPLPASAMGPFGPVRRGGAVAPAPPRDLHAADPPGPARADRRV